MNKQLETIFENAQSDDFKKFQNAFNDLRYLIERHSMNRYDEADKPDYLEIFTNKELIDYRLADSDLTQIKYFLFYVLFNYPDRATLIAKCIKVLFDKSIREAICSGIEIYMKDNDDATCELVFSITDIGDIENYLNNKRILDVFVKVSKFGGKQSGKAALYELNFYKKKFNSFFTW